jgi:hypothetical protein
MPYYETQVTICVYADNPEAGEERIKYVMNHGLRKDYDENWRWAVTRGGGPWITEIPAQGEE